MKLKIIIRRRRGYDGDDDGEFGMVIVISLIFLVIVVASIVYLSTPHSSAPKKTAVYENPKKLERASFSFL